jgi:DNA polymerase I-like protein with 3'-5' exonuclease and polymerase domains
LKLILYSKGVKAIGEDLHVTTEKAQEIYDSVMKAFPEMHKWLQDVQTFAKKNGYIDGFYGRRRRLPELLLDDYEFTFGKEYNEASQEFYKKDFINRLSHAKRAEKQQIINYAHKHNITIIDNTGKKAKALREVANSIIQGSSADICKIALNSIYRDEVMRKYDAKLVMSIHD